MQKKKRHHRRSIRLKGYDYTRAGLYFITICCADRRSLFGRVENGVMILNEAGIIADACWMEIPAHFPLAILHEYVIMPNHVHGIIELQTDPAVGANNYSPLLRGESQPICGTSRTIGSIVRGFKIGVTKWFRQNTDIETVWHRNYYEHVIRNEQSYNNISNYILNNPAKCMGECT